MSNGSAPADLQSAFSKLATDLQSASGASSSTSSDGGPQASLQAFLSKLQDSMGYAARSSSSATGNLVSSAA